MTRLTGLANRALFADRLNQAVQRQRRDLCPVSIMSLDLDHFKQVNDTLGHPAGDQLLIRVAERLLGCLRTTDTVARLGGDEFAVVIQENADTAARVADRIAESFTRPFMLDGHPYPARASIGLTTATGDATDITIGDLLKQADLALYAAKRTRTGRVHTYVPDLQPTPAARPQPLTPSVCALPQNRAPGPALA